MENAISRKFQMGSLLQFTLPSMVMELFFSY